MCLFAAGIFCNQYFWKIALAKIGFKPLMVSKALQYSANLFVSTVLVWLSFSLLYIYIFGNRPMENAVVEDQEKGIH